LQISPLISLNLLVFTCFMCFSLPPSLTIMHLCITKCTYWTPLQSRDLLVRHSTFIFNEITVYAQLNWTAVSVSQYYPSHQTVIIWKEVIWLLNEASVKCLDLPWRKFAMRSSGRDFMMNIFSRCRRRPLRRQSFSDGMRKRSRDDVTFVVDSFGWSVFLSVCLLFDPLKPLSRMLFRYSLRWTWKLKRWLTNGSCLFYSRTISSIPLFPHFLVDAYSPLGCGYEPIVSLFFSPSLPLPYSLFLFDLCLCLCVFVVLYLGLVWPTTHLHGRHAFIGGGRVGHCARSDARKRQIISYHPSTYL